MPPTWKLAQTLLGIRYFLVPPASRRERVLRSLLRKILGANYDRTANSAISAFRVWKREGFLALMRKVMGKPSVRSLSDRLQVEDGLVDSPAGVWCIIELPTSSAITVEAGVVSLRGWAWSREFGRGKVLLEIRSDLDSRTVPVEHRYCRFDLASIAPEIPPANYAGFEIAVDRFDLATQTNITVLFETPAQVYRIKTFQVAVAHENLIAGTQVVACDCCGSAEQMRVGSKDGLSIQRCQNCGLIFTSPRPDMARVQERYSADYFQREYLPEIQKSYPELSRHWNDILDQVEHFKSVSLHLFEVGSGAGYLLREAMRRGWTASGIELNSSAVKYAQGLGLEVIEGDIHQADLPREKFGAIILEYTLEHFLSPRQVLAKCADALLPGGGCLIWTIGCEGDKFLTQGMDFMYIGPSEHLYYFSISSLCRLCESVGLRVDRFWRDATGDAVALIASKRIDRWERNPSEDQLTMEFHGRILNQGQR